MFETLVANLSGKPELKIENGREYLVADVTLIVEGVLNGSRGPLFYPRDEYTKNAAEWDGVPLTKDHPTHNGVPVSARSTEVILRSGLGFLRNAQAEKNLTAKAWFDVQNTKRISQIIYTKLVNGEKIEISTGLGGDEDPTPGTYNNRSYRAIYRNYKPDHLAVFEDKVGACSVNDGCGVNNEHSCQNCGPDCNCPKCKKEFQSSASNKEFDMDREKLINNLVANCHCWTEEDREILNGFSDEKLQDFHDAYETSVSNQNLITGLTENGLQLGDETLEVTLNEGELVINADHGKHKKGMSMSDLSDEELENEMMKRKKMKNGSASSASHNEDSRPMKIEDLSPEDRAVFNYGRRALKEHRDTLIERLTANLEGDEKTTKVAQLQNRSIEDLEEIASLIPEEVHNQQPDQYSHIPVYSHPGARVNNSQPETLSPEPLPVVVENYGA